MEHVHQISAKLAATFNALQQPNPPKGSPKLKATRIRTRRRGTALIETEQGILVVSEDGTRFSLPGGAANRDEIDIQAAIRELREETGLCAYSAQYLFSHLGGIRKRGATYSRNYHQVFLIKAEGFPKPRQEIKVVHLYRPGDLIKISKSTQKILERYQSLQINSV